MKLQAAEKEYAENESAVSDCLGSCYNGPYTDWEHVLAEMKELGEHFQDDQASFYALASMEKGAFLNAQNAFKADAKELKDEITAVEEAKQRVSQLFAPETLDLDAGEYSQCIQKLGSCLDSIDRLSNWISFIDLLHQIRESNIGCISARDLDDSGKIRVLNLFTRITSDKRQFPLEKADYSLKTQSAILKPM